jgi:hypothetical protein
LVEAGLRLVTAEPPAAAPAVAPRAVPGRPTVG